MTFDQDHATSANPLSTAPPPVMSSDQILNHLDATYKSLPGPVQAALDHAHTLTGGNGTLGGVATPEPKPQTPIAPAPVSPSDVLVPGITGVRQSDIAASAPTLPTPDNTAAPLPLMMRTLPPMGRAMSPEEQELGRITAPPIQSGPLAHTKADTGRSGIGQIHNPWLRGLATAGDVIASGVFPRFGAFIPGTSAHHALEVNQAANQVKREQEEQKSADESAQQQALTAKTNADIPLEQAEAANYVSEADARNNPDYQPLSHPVIDPADPTGQSRTGYFDKKTGSIKYGPVVGAQPEAPKGPTFEKLDNGDVVAIHYDPQTKKSASEVAYHGDPKVETQITTLEVGGKPHSVIVDKKTGKTVKDLGETGEKPPNVNVNTGTYSLEEDSAGHPVLLNNKTGETKAAPNIQKSGTKEKADAAREKELAPAQDALNYAEDYEQSGRPTGPKDEALMEKYFELAKPSTGFRMSQQQMDMLKKARSAYQGVAATMHHAATGTWFSDQQRKEIIDAMRSLAAAKLKSSGVTGQASPESNSTLPGDITLDEVNAELERRKGGK